MVMKSALKTVTIAALLLVSLSNLQAQTTNHNKYGSVIASPSSTVNWHRFSTSYGYIDFGPANYDWAHIYTGSDKFIFNKDLK